MNQYSNSRNSALLELLATREVAHLLGISHKTLERMRMEGTGPKFIKVGRSVRYRLSDVQEWIEQNVRQSTSEIDEGRAA